MAEPCYSEVTAIRVPAAVAVDRYGTGSWAQWVFAAPSMYWHFDQPIALYPSAGMVESRPLGEWAGSGTLVIQEGDLVMLPAGYEATWLGFPSVTILWKVGHVALAGRPLPKGPSVVTFETAATSSAVATSGHPAADEVVGTADASGGSLDVDSQGAVAEGDSGRACGTCPSPSPAKPPGVPIAADPWIAGGTARMPPVKALPTRVVGNKAGSPVPPSVVFTSVIGTGPGGGTFAGEIKFPRGWIPVPDERGMTYWWNTLNGSATWIQPQAPADDPQFM